MRKFGLLINLSASRSHLYLEKYIHVTGELARERSAMLFVLYEVSISNLLLSFEDAFDRRKSRLARTFLRRIVVRGSIVPNFVSRDI